MPTRAVVLILLHFEARRTGGGGREGIVGFLLYKFIILLKDGNRDFMMGPSKYLRAMDWIEDLSCAFGKESRGKCEGVLDHRSLYLRCWISY